MGIRAPLVPPGPLDLLDRLTPTTDSIVMKTTPELTEDRKERKETRASEVFQEPLAKELAPTLMSTPI